MVYYCFIVSAFISPHICAHRAVEEAAVTTSFARAEHVFAGLLHHDDTVSSTDCKFSERPFNHDTLSNCSRSLSLNRIYPVQEKTSRASRALDLFPRFIMVKLMHAAIPGLWRSLRASCADKHGLFGRAHSVAEV